MDQWTMLVITILSGPLDGAFSGVIYPSMEACDAARVPVSETLAYDYKLQCIEMGQASSSPRPMPRPEGLTDD